MYTNVNLAAQIGVVLLLGAGLVMLLLSVVFLYLVVTRKFSQSRLVAGALLVIVGGYLAAMLIFSFASRDEVLARGQEKHFCELDCHLAYSVANVVQTKTLGSAADAISAKGTFYLITVKTRFDENTISARRGSGLLSPNPRAIKVMDATGVCYSPSVADQDLLTRVGITGTPITTPLRPAETYTTTFVFDLPSNINHPTLVINESDWITHLIIGHENSLAHKKITFQI